MLGFSSNSADSEIIIDYLMVVEKVFKTKQLLSWDFIYRKQESKKQENTLSTNKLLEIISMETLFKIILWILRIDIFKMFLPF